MKKVFYGWWVTAAAFLTFGLSVGLPYYNNPFFYDYYAKAFHWSKSDITFGFPLAALLTIWVGPLLVPRFSPRKLILAGTFLTCLAFLGWGNMSGSLWVYWGLWFVYTVGYILSGPIPHQIIISQWFRKRRGTAMGVLYVGVGLIGFLGSYLVKPLTEHFVRTQHNFQFALMVMGGLVLLSWPFAILVLRDRPAEKGLYPDGAPAPPAEISLKPREYRDLIRRYSFWLLLLGSCCSIGAIGSVNFHMKFVFQDHMRLQASDPNYQPLLNSTWQFASMLILASSIGGRLVIGGFSDKFNKKWVMAISYFLSALTIPILMTVQPPADPWVFGLLFGFAMGADYMLIPLMAAEQFGVNTLARAMAIILPLNTIAQTWLPYLVARLRDAYGSYTIPMGLIFTLALLSGLAIALMPRKEKEFADAALPVPDARGAAAKR